MSGDELFDIEETEESNRAAEYWKAVQCVAQRVIDIDKTHHMGTEYLHALLGFLGVKEDVDAIAKADWAAMCEWDL